MTYKMAPVREDLTLDETWSTLLRPRSTCLVFFRLCLLLRNRFPCDLISLGFGSVKSEILQSPSPKDRQREFHASREIILASVNCVKLKDVSYTSNLLEQMYDFQKCTRLLVMLILSLPDLQQNQSPETILIYLVVLCFPHNSIVGIHKCDDFERSKAWEVKRAEQLSPLVIFGLLTASPARSRCTQKRPPFHRCAHCWYSPRAFTRSHPLPVDTFSVPTIKDGNARTVTVLPVLA